MVAPGDYEKIMNVEKKEVAKEKKEGTDLLENLTYPTSIFNKSNNNNYNLYQLTAIRAISCDLLCELLSHHTQ